MSAEFHWNKSSAQIISDKGFGKELNKFIAQTLYEYSYEYTPYDPYRTSGAHMVDNVRIMATEEKGQIVYQSSYAKILWDGTYHFNTMIHPLACNEWTNVAWLNHKDEILAEADAYRKSISR